MLVRLFKANEEIILVFGTGNVLTLDESGIRDFFLNADRYLEDNLNTSLNIPILGRSLNIGDTLAYIDNERKLVIVDLPFFKSIMSKPVELLTAEEYAELHGKKRPIILRYLRERRLPGAIKKGEVWLIPKDCPYPKDPRIGSRVKPLY